MKWSTAAYLRRLEGSARERAKRVKPLVKYLMSTKVCMIREKGRRASRKVIKEQRSRRGKELGWQSIKTWLHMINTYGGETDDCRNERQSSTRVCTPS